MVPIKAIFFHHPFLQRRRFLPLSSQPVRHSWSKGVSEGGRTLRKAEKGQILGVGAVAIRATFFTTACHGEAASGDGRKMRTQRKPCFFGKGVVPVTVLKGSFRQDQQD